VGLEGSACRQHPSATRPLHASVDAALGPLTRDGTLARLQKR
jgi:hypothetical protein